MDTLLNELLKNGILDETVICKIKEMENQEYLKKHRYKIYQNKDGRSSDPAKPVEWMVERRNEYLKKIEMVEQAAIEADCDIYKYLLKGVTEGLSYGCLRADGLLCSRDYYYHQYRRFFYCLSRLRR